MTEPSHDPLIDVYLDQMLRGAAPPLGEFVERHRGLSDDARMRLEQLAGAFAEMGDPSLLAQSDASAVTEPLPFARLGRYRLIRKLAQGGMGAVYLAEQEPLARLVALKIVRPELSASSVARQRFAREALAIARLKHPSIVTVHDAGEERGIAYLAMDLVPGRGLDELLIEAAQRGERLSVAQSVRHARDVALALDAAHVVGIIHRDVKPANIRITPDGRALLLDFGLAHGDDLASLSVTGQFRGTPSYASPEQVAAGKVELDARTDVYSLGVTLYECVTGAVPFRGATTQQIFHQILMRDPPAARRTNPSISRDLETVIATAMEKERERRYGSAAALAADLDALLEMRPVSARPLAPLARLARSCRRRPARVLAIALAVLILIGAPLGYGALERRSRLLLERQFAAAQWEAYTGNLAAAAAELEWGSTAAARLRLEAAPRALRDWEWWYLARRLDRSLATIPFGFDAAIAAAVLPDDGLAAIAFADARIELRQLHDGKLVRVVRTSGGPPTAVALAPDHEWVAAGMRTGAVQLFATGADTSGASDATGPAHVITIASESVTAVGFHPDGTRLAAAAGSKVHVYDTADWRPVLELGDVPGGVTALAFSPDGRSIACGAEDRATMFFDLDGGRKRKLGGHSQGVRHVAFSADGALLASAGRDGGVCLYSTSTLEGYNKMSPAITEVPCTAFDPAGQMIAACQLDGGISVWNVKRGTRRSTLRGLTSPPLCLAFLDGGERLASVAEHEIKLFAPKVGDRPGFTTDLEAGAISAGGTLCAIALPDGARVIDRATESRIDLLGLAQPAREVEFSPDGERLAACTGAATVRIWDVKTRAKLFDLEHGSAGVDGMAWPSRDTLVTRTADHRLHVWSVGDRGDERLVIDGDGPIDAFAVSPGVDRVVLASRSGGVAIHDLRTGARTGTLPSLGRAATAIAFAPDGERLALGYDDGGIALWRAGGERPIATLSGHHGAVLGLAFHPAGRRLASASADHSIRMWDLEHCDEVLALTEQLGPVRRLVFDAAGDTLLAVVARHALLLFEIGGESERAVAALADDLILDQDVRQALAKQADLDAPARQAALALVERRPIDAQLLFRASFAVACEAGHERGAYERARRQAQLASEHHPDDGEMLTALGLAQYRLGDFAQARITLARADERNVRRYQSSVPIDVAVLAMCDAALGDRARARERCAQLEPLMRVAPWRDDARCAALCLEARRIVLGREDRR